MTNQIAQLKRAVKAVKEANPVKKGDIVAVVTLTRPAVAYNAPASVSREAFETWRLAHVVSATRTGKATKVQYCGWGSSQELIPGDGRWTVWTLGKSDPAKVAAVAKLAATLTAETNSFTDGAELREAILRNVEG